MERARLPDGTRALQDGPGRRSDNEPGSAAEDHEASPRRPEPAEADAHPRGARHEREGIDHCDSPGDEPDERVQERPVPGARVRGVEAEDRSDERNDPGPGSDEEGEDAHGPEAG